MHFCTTKTVQQMSGALHSPAPQFGPGENKALLAPRQLAGYKRVSYGGT